MIVGLNYATHDFYDFAQRQVNEYPIDVRLVQGNKIAVKGNGFWRWKPTIIMNLLNQLNENDVVLYFDAGDEHKPEFFDFVEKHFETNDNLFVNTGIGENRMWTKGDCFLGMNCEYLMDFDYLQCESGLIGLRVNQANKNLVMEWNNFMKVDYYVNDEKSVMRKDFAVFYEHRNEQSILTNVLLMNNIDYSTNINQFVQRNKYKPQ